MPLTPLLVNLSEWKNNALANQGAGLDKDIKSLGNELKFVNIVVVPVLFAVVALLIGYWRRRPEARS